MKYSPLQRRSNEILHHCLELLYPRSFTEEQIKPILVLINTCTCRRELYQVLLSKDFVKDDRLYHAFYQKLQELHPASRLLPYKKQPPREPLSPWQRKLYLDTAKNMLPPIKWQYAIATELNRFIRACETRAELLHLIYSLEFTKEAELDAIEKRYFELR